MWSQLENGCVFVMWPTLEFLGLIPESNPLLMQTLGSTVVAFVVSFLSQARPGLYPRILMSALSQFWHYEHLEMKPVSKSRVCLVPPSPRNNFLEK